MNYFQIGLIETEISKELLETLKEFNQNFDLMIKTINELTEILKSLTLRGYR